MKSLWSTIKANSSSSSQSATTFFSPLALWERVGEREIRANPNTLIRLSGTFSQWEKGFCKLPKERRGFDKRCLNTLGILRHLDLLVNLNENHSHLKFKGIFYDHCFHNPISRSPTISPGRGQFPRARF
jgi:hypothetical protein